MVFDDVLVYGINLGPLSNAEVRVNGRKVFPKPRIKVNVAERSETCAECTFIIEAGDQTFERDGVLRCYSCGRKDADAR